jgi:hypothetical protein
LDSLLGASLFSVPEEEAALDAAGAAPPGSARAGATGAVVAPNAAGPPNAPPCVLELGMPGALVRFPDEPAPRAFKVGLPVPAAPLPAGSPAPGNPPPTAPAAGPPPTRPAGAPPPTAALPAPAAPTPPPSVPPLRPPSAANANAIGSAARSSGAARSFNVRATMTSRLA